MNSISKVGVASICAVGVASTRIVGVPPVLYGLTCFEWAWLHEPNSGRGLKACGVTVTSSQPEEYRWGLWSVRDLTTPGVDDGRVHTVCGVDVTLQVVMSDLTRSGVDDVTPRSTE